MQRRSIRLLSLIMAAQVAAASASAWGQVRITQSNPTGLYKAGETAKFVISIDPNTAAEGKDFTYRFRLHGAGGGPNAGEAKPIDVSNGSAEVSTSVNEPATTLLEVAWKKADGKDAKAHMGAVFDFEQIQPSSPAPDDFDAFWQAQLEQLAAVPMNAQVEPVELPPATQPSDPDPAKIEYSKVTLDNIDGSMIYGHLARPKPADGKKYPAVLMVQYAGVYGLPRAQVIDRAKPGWIAFNIMPHDVPLDLPAEEYKALGNGKLKNYAMLGNEKKETSYFRRMFLSCYRGAEYLAQQPDWNGEVLVATGGSQGGMQAIVAAALHPKVTHVICNVPAGCDTTQALHGKLAGWPGWAGWGSPNAKELENRKAAIETSRYYDPVNFAPRVKAPTLIGMGLADTVSTPAGPFALYNKLAGPKRIVIVPHADHQGVGNAFNVVYKVHGEWWKALQEGKPLALGDGQ